MFDGTVHLEVLEIEAPHRMRWPWRGGPIDTRVTFEVVETRPGATVWTWPESDELPAELRGVSDIAPGPRPLREGEVPRTR